MQPDLPACIRALEAYPAILTTLLTTVTADEARHKPASGAWSIVEIVNHLADEEVDDFRTRLRLTLENPEQEWPPIDPERSAIERNYSDRRPGDSLMCFAQAREESTLWLRSLNASAIDWAVTHSHPKWPTRAGDLLASWMAHDMLHLRQLAKRLHELATVRSGGFDGGYAGPMN